MVAYSEYGGMQLFNQSVGIIKKFDRTFLNKMRI